MRISTIVLAVTLLAAMHTGMVPAQPGIVPGNETETPEPTATNTPVPPTATPVPPTATPPNVPEWDKSGLTVEGECYSDDPPPAPLLPTFFIKNAGSGDMLFPSFWGIRPGTNGAAACADLVSTFVQTGTVKLASGDVAMIVVDTTLLPTGPQLGAGDRLKLAADGLG